MDLKEIILKLTNNHGVSGREENIKEIIRKIVEPISDKVWTDKLGNLFALKEGKSKDKKRFLISAHMDQIGMIVLKIEENGIIKFHSLGGINPLTLGGTPVIIHGKEKLYGVIGLRPPHIAREGEAGKIGNMKELYIDTGYTRKELKDKVQTGDIITYDFETEILFDKYPMGQAMDNRAGCLTLIAMLDRLQIIKNRHDVIAMFSVQEEVGLRGAKVGTYSVEADFGAALDVTFADPIADQRDTIKFNDPGFGLDKGPNFCPKLREQFVKIMDDESIPYQDCLAPYPGGTDAYMMQIINGGIPVLGIDIPLKYMHTPTEFVNLTQISNAARALAIASALIEFPCSEEVIK
ncbi:MAG: M20/M25/M40 family metallo-hydrolase [Candidatus Coatesbacteria bacterium]|nr:M20/M25/M40 family metallo-hydrolase [Candidatus Coatesbacteria bacterium]